MENESTAEIPHGFNIVMGALISKGLGQCELRKTRLVEADPPKLGFLRTRIPVDKQSIFNIRRIIMPVYGYLFEPTSTTSGKYVLSLFEGSAVVAPEFLVSSK